MALLMDKNETLPPIIQTVENNLMSYMSPAFPLITQPLKKLVDSDEKIDRLYSDFDRISRLLQRHQTPFSSEGTSFMEGKAGERRRTLSGKIRCLF